MCKSTSLFLWGAVAHKRRTPKKIQPPAPGTERTKKQSGKEALCKKSVFAMAINQQETRYNVKEVLVEETSGRSEHQIRVPSHRGIIMPRSARFITNFQQQQTEP
jgi:hypothetical protein